MPFFFTNKPCRSSAQRLRRRNSCVVAFLAIIACAYASTMYHGYCLLLQGDSVAMPPPSSTTVNTTPMIIQEGKHPTREIESTKMEICHAQGLEVVCTPKQRVESVQESDASLPPHSISTNPISTTWFRPFPKYCGSQPLHPMMRCANLGDELGPLLLHWFVGKPIEYREYGMDVDVLVIGSVINYHISDYERFAKRLNHRYNITIWGAGTKWGVKGTCFDYRAVRGPKTRDVLMKFGCWVPEIYGDPALLLPYFYDPRQFTPVDKSIDLCIIPHFADFIDPENFLFWSSQGEAPDLTSRFGHTDLHIHEDGTNEDYIIRVLDIRTPDASSFISLLNTCPMVASAALHGIILAEAYGIKWSWVQMSPKTEEGPFKYHDFFLSVGLNPAEVKPLLLEANKTSVQEIIMHTTLTLKRGKSVFDPVALLDACPFCRKDIVERIKSLARTDTSGHIAQ